MTKTVRSRAGVSVRFQTERLLGRYIEFMVNKSFGGFFFACFVSERYHDGNILLIIYLKRIIHRMYTNFVQALMSLFLRSQLCRGPRYSKYTYDFRDIATRFSTFATGVVDTGGEP
jgi:hypothetical protein